ncbi:MAG: PIN domain-containing protein [bacterium]|nr:PIN domain-containing protein [bacterium]
MIINGLLDTNVLIDVLRNYQPANYWLAQQSQLGISRFIHMELIEGARNKQELKQILAFLRNFATIPVFDDDVIWAQNQLAKYNLSHQVGSLDCLIASSAHRLQLPLYTLNIKDFKPLLGNLAQRPY